MYSYSQIQFSLAKFYQLTMRLAQNREEIDQLVHQKSRARRKIIEHNKKFVSKCANIPNKLTNLRALISMPSLPLQKRFFLDSIRTIPRPPQHSSQLKYPFYFRKFRFIYFLIGKPSQGIWEAFKSVYEQYVPQQQRPLANLASPDSEQKYKAVLKTLQGFIDSNLQVRVIVEKQNNQALLKIQEFRELLKKEDIIEFVSENKWSQVNKKIRYVDQIKTFFQKQVCRLIRRSVNDKIVLQYNFINTKAPSSEVFTIKNLIQKCLEPRQNSQSLAIHKDFALYLKKYENKNCLNVIDDYLENLNTKSGDINQKISQCYKQIAKIQNEEQQFLSYFEKFLEKKDPIEKQPQLREILVRIIQQYKQDHSFYEVINTNIRLSLSPNQSMIKRLSVMIKYLFEAIQIFFLHYRNKFTFNKLYRGCLFSKEEIDNLHEGDIVRNLGFMSTTMSLAVANNFKGDQGYIVTIEFTDLFKSSLEDIEGFMDLNLLLKQEGKQIKDKLGQEQQILFNPFNTFRVTNINISQKRITLQYAPHLQLLEKINQNKASAKEIEQYNRIKLNIQSLNKSSYDKGMILHKKGETTKALQYYREAESKGEVLTTEEKFNKITILKENRDLDQVQKQLKQMVKKVEIQQVNNKIQDASKQDKVKWIKSLTQISQLLQETTNFIEAESKAIQAVKVSQNLNKQIEKTKVITRKEMLQTLYSNLLPSIELARSKNSTNQIEISLQKTIEGFLVLDEMYTIYTEDVIPELQQTIRTIPSNAQELCKQKCRILFNRCLDPLKYVLKQKNYSKMLNNFSEGKQRKLNKLRHVSDKLKKEGNRQQLQDTISSYFKYRTQTRDRLSALFQVFYPAAIQLNQVSGQSHQFKVMRDSFTFLKEKTQELLRCEKQLYDVMKINLKNFNIEIRSCMIDEKQNFYGRFEKFKKVQQQLRKQELDSDTIKQYTRYATFLVELASLERDAKIVQKHKQQSKIILDQLSDKIKVQENNTQVNLTKQKTIIIESQIQAYKNYYNEESIINKSAAANTAHTGSVSFKSVAGTKMRKDFLQISKLLNQLQQLHESDSQINGFYYSLKDTKDQIQLLNESQSISQSPEEYQKFLIDAARKYEQFKFKYLAKIEETKYKYSQKLAQLQCEIAENNLRRGLFKRAQKQLKQLEDIFTKIYKLPNQTGNHKNKLYARDLPIKACRLKAQLVGIYGNQRERINLTHDLMDYKLAVIDRNAASKVNSCALISEAIAFVASRCIPKSISQYKNVYQNYLKYAEQAFLNSIKFRKCMLGDDNQYLAIAYANLVILGCKDRKNRKQQYNKAQKIFLTLKAPINNQSPRTHFDANPALYLCLMNMETIYKLQFEFDSRRDATKAQIQKSYKDNVSNFIAKRKDLKSIEAAQNFYTAGRFLSANEKYKQESEQFLITCEKEINAINSMNDQTQEGQETKKRLSIEYLKLNLFNFLAQYYGKYENNANKSKYESFGKDIQKRIKQQDPDIIIKKPRVKSPNFMQFTLQMFQKCTGLQNTSK